tara:strand:+ start:966 stop:1376 length:411 start_codon:yes stop_codon:yes gene_type:complete
MRRVKSAPSNLCQMKHKKVTINSSANKVFYIPNNNNNNNNNYEILKKSKIYLSKVGNFCSDLINDSNILSLEHSLLISGIISYFSDNILKKDKLKEIANFSIQSLLRYFILYYIHTEVLHDKLHNNVLEIAQHIIQ